MKDLFKKNQEVSLFICCIFLSFFILISSCKKESSQKIKINATEAQKTNITVEKVDKELLLKYVIYESKLEANNLKSKTNSFNPSDIEDLKINKFEFKKMIDNYLANERNVMRQEYFEKMNINKPHITSKLATANLPKCYDSFGDQVDCDVVIPTGGSEGGSSVSCSGSFSGVNSTNTILFQGVLNNNNTSIASSTIGFGGISGICAPLGSITQELYQGVITYQQYYSETISVSNSVTYTQLFLIYGNIYNGACTVHGIKVVAPN